MPVHAIGEADALYPSTAMQPPQQRTPLQLLHSPRPPSTERGPKQATRVGKRAATKMLTCPTLRISRSSRLSRPPTTAAPRTATLSSQSARETGMTAPRPMAARMIQIVVSYMLTAVAELASSSWLSTPPPCLMHSGIHRLRYRRVATARMERARLWSSCPFPRESLATFSRLMRRICSALGVWGRSSNHARPCPAPAKSPSVRL